MNTEVINHIHKSFEILTTKYDFSMLNEINEDDGYLVKYVSKDFVIEIVSYYRELYTAVYKTDKHKDGIGLHNLMDFLKQDSLDKSEANFFRNETNLDECYMKQVSYIVTVLVDNYSLIKDFYKSDNFQLRYNEFEKYWKTQHPEFYKTQ